MRHCYSSCFFPLSFLVKTIPFGIVLKISMLCVEVYLGTCYQLSWSYFQYFQDSFEESWKHLLNVRIHQSFHYWWNGFMDYWWQLFLIPVSFPLKVFFFEIIAGIWAASFRAFRDHGAVLSLRTWLPQLHFQSYDLKSSELVQRLRRALNRKQWRSFGN